MTYDQLRAEEDKAWQAYQDATEAEDRRRVEAGTELTRLCAAWADLQRRRSSMAAPILVESKASFMDRVRQGLELMAKQNHSPPPAPFPDSVTAAPIETGHEVIWPYQRSILEGIEKRHQKRLAAMESPTPKTCPTCGKEL